MKICFVSWSLSYTKKDIFENDNLMQFKLLKDALDKKGITIATNNEISMKDADMIIFSDTMGYWNYMLINEAIKLGKTQNSIYIALEPPVVAAINQPEKMLNWSNIFKRVITVQSDLDGKGNIRYYTDTIDKTCYTDVSACEKVQERKLLTSISANKVSLCEGELYSARQEAYKFFAEKCPEQFDFYGIGWDPIEYTAYKGKVAIKIDTLSNYKFALAYENMDNCNGYITEKPIDVMKAGAVPVYRGAKNITDYIDKECLIFADDFATLDELYDYLVNMTDEEYNRRLTSIQEFLTGDKYYKFTVNYWVELMMDAILCEEKSTLTNHQCMKKFNKYYGRNKFNVRISNLLKFRWLRRNI